MLRLFFALFLAHPVMEANASVIMLLFWGYPAEDTRYCVNKSPAGTFGSCIDLCLGCDLCMDPYGNSYKFSYDGPDWAVTYPKSCPLGGLKMFPRPFGPFCIWVDKSIEPITRNNALMPCKYLVDGGYLAGVTSVAEYNYVLSSSKSQYPNLTNYDYLGVWITGLMKSECESTQVAGCSGINAFQEFPGQTTFDYYNFPTRYPDFTKRRSPSVQSRCLQLVWVQQKSAFDGKVINAACEYGCNEAETICTYSFICGVLAT